MLLLYDALFATDDFAWDEKDVRAATEYKWQSEDEKYDNGKERRIIET